MSIRVAVILAMVLASSAPARAVLPGEQLADPVQEARARAISTELRCLVCQNQSIDDSDASLARDLRLLVRERIRAGDDDQAIRAYLVGRYGEFVLLRPSLNWQTLLLWITPFFALLLGTLAARSAFRHRQEESALENEPSPLSENEKEALQAIFDRRAQVTRSAEHPLGTLNSGNLKSE